MAKKRATLSRKVAKKSNQYYKETDPEKFW
jgi:hypothetical protein